MSHIGIGTAHCTTLPVLCFDNPKLGMNETCSALLDVKGCSYPVFKLPREIIIIATFKNLSFQLHIFMNVPMNTLRIYLSISNVVFSRNLEKTAKLSSEILLLLFFKITRKCSAISDHLSLLTRHFFSWIDNIHPSAVQFLHLLQ
jgi:hypothetical protein